MAPRALIVPLMMVMTPIELNVVLVRYNDVFIVSGGVLLMQTPSAGTKFLAANVRGFQRSVG